MSRVWGLKGQGSQGLGVLKVRGLKSQGSGVMCQIIRPKRSLALKTKSCTFSNDADFGYIIMLANSDASQENKVKIIFHAKCYHFWGDGGFS